MQVRKVLNIEDTPSKHAAIKRALERCGIQNIDYANTAMEGLSMIEAAIEEGKPYHLIVTDWYYPIFPRESEVDAGRYVINQLEERGIDVPIIVCSSARIMEPRAVGCILYNDRYDLDADMREAVDIVRNM